LDQQDPGPVQHFGTEFHAAEITFSRATFLAYMNLLGRSSLGCFEIFSNGSNE
jgi:hypothetical protein